MKFLRTCPILIGIVVIAILLTVVSYAYEDTTYSEYQAEYDSAKAPHFVLVCKGLTDGIFPWDNIVQDEIAAEAEIPDEETPVAEEVEENTEPEEIIIIDESEDGDEENSASEDEIYEEDPDRTWELTPVDKDYFADALFIGDSRTVGLSEYCEELDENATFYAKVSLTIYDCMRKSFIKTDEGKINIEQALSEQQFAKIYIMLGLNEIGTGTSETFCEAYLDVINQIRELQPDAIIFIQGIMHVTQRKSESNKYFSNDNINRRNEALSQLADNKTIFFIDMNEAVDDENGNLLSELSFDDVHLKASSYQRWYDYLLEHGVVKE